MSGPLAGIKVLDLTRVLSGPFATMLLGDLGADVVKVEEPGTGDTTRHTQPFINGQSHYFVAINRNKRSLALDLKSAAGKQVLLDLVRWADVVVENFRPGVLDRLGMGYDRMLGENPRVIVCGISGFGQDGPLRDKPSFDVIAQAMGGAMSVTGDPGGPPMRLGLPMGDLSGGLYAVIGILAALEERRRTGRGRVVDVSLLDCMVGLLGYLATLRFATGEDPEPVGSRHHQIVPYGAFRCADGYIVIAVFTGAFWRKFCPAIGHPELVTDPRFARTADRMKNRAELEALVESILRERTVAEWSQVFDSGDVPAAPIHGVGAVFEDPQVKHRQMRLILDHPVYGQVPVSGPVVKFPGTPSRPAMAPPLLGEHSVSVLQGLGYGSDDIQRLLEARVIERPDAARGRS
jgi:crotonobetainyl-CoA:carnitine CoA-transferase CaiB-like acyl-CoA transferase